MFELLINLIFLLMILIPLSFLLGKFISINFLNDKNTVFTKAEKIYNYIENPIHRFCGINPDKKYNAKEYFLALFYSNVVLSIICFFALYFQNLLPFRGDIKYQLNIPLILHILSSLITNTCQTHHIPELHLTPLSNFFIMPLLMFYSSASGLATGIMVMRSITKGEIGNPYVDVIKAMTRILFPLCTLATLIFTLTGVPNTFNLSISYNTLENIKETLILGPVASFEAIKLLGENGLSYFNANSAHPFENPSYISNFIQLICILIIPFALINTLGFWLNNHKQTIVILCVLTIVLLFEFTLVTQKELGGNPLINKITDEISPNWVGKETRFGIIGSSIFSAAISNVSGSANSSIDSFHPIVNFFGLFNLSNQSVFGVQGFGLVFTINFVLYTAFFIGLMLGKTPLLFGKRIEKNEVILSSILLLVNPILVLVGTVITINYYPEYFSNFYEQVHYFTRVFYEFASGASSNGSGLEGLNDNTPYWNLSLAIVMFIARYIAMAAMILLGGSFANKYTIPLTSGEFRTDSILFGFIFLFMSIISTLLIYFPFFLLGPINEMLLTH